MLVTRCHEIQVSLDNREIPEFEQIPEIGMAVRLALHIRGLPIIDYKILRMVASAILGIPSVGLERILRLLAEVGFVRIVSVGTSIQGILPLVPYYEDMYLQLDQYVSQNKVFNEHEQLALNIIERLSKSPENVDGLRNQIGAEKKVFNRIVSAGTEGSFLIEREARGRKILLSPTYFSENADLFADGAAAAGTKAISKLMETIKTNQGWPLSRIMKQKKLGEASLDKSQLNLLKRLAEDGLVKPPSITTSHSGENYFLFTPTPAGAALSPTKRDVYEKAMAIVAAVRQGQFLPKQYAIRSPGAVIYTLKRDLKLKKATTEAVEQYRKLVHLRIGRLIDVGNGYAEFHINDQPENREALKIAYDLVSGGEPSEMEVDDQARMALQQDQSYVESLVASANLRKREPVKLNESDQYELDFLFLGGK
jgi:hypothetical protein